MVLAVGVTRQWRSTLLGTGAAILVLVALVGILGTAIATLIPIEALRLIVGAVLIVFGLQWLSKAVLRAAGVRATRNELANFGRQVAALAAEAPIPAAGIDWVSFTVAFKGVLLEGLEVAFVVVTFGAAAGLLMPAAIGAALAGVLVVGVGVVVRRPLAGLPENHMKFGVGLMLVSFGTFWAGEGVGIDWIGGDLAILLLLAGYLLISLLAVRLASASLVSAADPSPVRSAQEAR